MLYTPSDIWFALLICLIIYLYERRKKNKEEEKRALEREKWARLHREREQREREEEAEREERMRRYRESLKTVLIYLTEEEMKKERFCQKRSGDIVISHNAISLVYHLPIAPRKLFCFVPIHPLGCIGWSALPMQAG